MSETIHVACVAGAHLMKADAEGLLANRMMRVNGLAGLGVRATKALRKLNIQSADELRQVTEWDLLSLKNCGWTTVNEIIAWAALQGVALKVIPAHKQGN